MLDFKEYNQKTSKILKLLDLHILLCIWFTIMNLLYKMIETNLTNNSFVNTTYFCFSSAILTFCFRLKFTNLNKQEQLYNGRLIWEFFFANVVLLIGNFLAYQY